MGWVRVFSYTRPRESIVSYQPWYLFEDGKWVVHKLGEGRAHGRGIVARLETCEDRDAACQMVGREIGIQRAQFPELVPGEYYWSDLEGLTVVTLSGDRLGVVSHLLETGANDVLVVSGDAEYLVPFVVGDVVHEVDFETGEIRVDWSRDF
jgi:16S rRNA processing protein RimM